MSRIFENTAQNLRRIARHEDELELSGPFSLNSAGTSVTPHGEFARDLCRIEPSIQPLQFQAQGDSRLIHFTGQIGLGKLDRIALVLFGQFEALIQLSLESAFANLLQNIGAASFVDFECFAAVEADDFVHVGSSSFHLLLTSGLFGRIASLARGSETRAPSFSRITGPNL